MQDLENTKAFNSREDIDKLVAKISEVSGSTVDEKPWEPLDLRAKTATQEALVERKEVDWKVIHNRFIQ